jgi:hypothetical protein
MRGHTSSVKTTTFFDPTRSHLDPSTSSSIIASAGRDGNILIFDLRCQGRVSDSPSPITRPNLSHGINGFSTQKDTKILEPVMTIRGAHGEASRKTSPAWHVCPALSSHICSADVTAYCPSISHQSGSFAVHAWTVGVWRLLRWVSSIVMKSRTNS